MLFSLVTALIGELALATPVFHGGASAFQTCRLLLPAMGTVMAGFNAGLAHQGLTQSGVYVGGGGTSQCTLGSCVNSLLAVCTENVGVVGLRAYFIHGVGREGVAGGCSAGRMTFKMELAALVSLIDLTARLVLTWGQSDQS